MPVTMRLASMTCGASGCWREKASSRAVRLAARVVASVAASTNFSTSVSPRASLRWIRFMALMMTASMLLKSCAMPPVSWPTASIFCIWRICDFGRLARRDLVAQRLVRRRQAFMRRDHVAQPPPCVEEAVDGHGEDAEQGDYRRPAQPVVGALGGRETLLQIGILLAAHFADDGADAVHGDLAAIGPQDCQRAGGVAVPVKRDRLVDLGKFLRNRGAQRLELRRPLRDLTRRPRRSPRFPQAGPRPPSGRGRDRNPRRSAESRAGRSRHPGPATAR